MGGSRSFVRRSVNGQLIEVPAFRLVLESPNEQSPREVNLQEKAIFAASLEGEGMGCRHG